jgi:hypothetical protein
MVLCALDQFEFQVYASFLTNQDNNGEFILCLD